jgi:hypothetical protein
MRLLPFPQHSSDGSANPETVVRRVARLLRIGAVVGLLVALIVSARASQGSRSTSVVVAASQSAAAAPTSCAVEDRQEADAAHAATVAGDVEDIQEHSAPANLAEDQSERAAQLAAHNAEVQEDEQEATGYGGCR